MSAINMEWLMLHFQWRYVTSIVPYAIKKFLVHFVYLYLLILWGYYRLELFLYGLMCTT